MTSGDCDGAARMRFEATGLGFLPALGQRFYAELLRATLRTSSGFGTVCVDDDERLLGFTVATVDTARYTAELVRRGPALAVHAVVGLAGHPARLWQALKYVLQATGAPRPDIPAQWLTIMVTQDAYRRGVATALTEALIAEFSRRGVKEFRSTVAASNTASCRIHDKFGFELLEKYQLAGEPTNLYRKVV